MSATIDERLRARILPVRLMIFDVDGVLTDGRIIYHDDGSEIKAFDVQDGHGIKLLQRAGIEVALITGRFCQAVEHRARGLGIHRVYQGARDKLEAYTEILAETGLTHKEMGFMGDDLIDIPLLRRVGFAAVVSNAVAHVVPFAHYVTRATGGYGACREVCELLLQVQGLWAEVTEPYFRDPEPRGQ
jgi:3-deoxy-D-manno-octulosonate 8-phosphate phosphatase (KDO 8-P phosphatase)